MTRLNKDIKDDVVRAAVKKAGIPEKEKSLLERRAAWLERVRVHCLGGAEICRKLERFARSFEKKTAEFPLAYVGDPFTTSRSLRVNMSGPVTLVYFDGGFKYTSSSECPCPIVPRKCVLPQDHELSTEFAQLEQEREELEALRDKVAGATRAAISNVGTVERLLKAWPEAAELLPRIVKSASNLPAIRTDDLNALIGLPSEVE